MAGSSAEACDRCGVALVLGNQEGHVPDEGVGVVLPQTGRVVSRENGVEEILKEIMVGKNIRNFV